MIDISFINNIALVLTGTFGIFLAIWVYFADRKNKVNRGLSLMIVLILSWIIFYHLAYVSSQRAMSLVLFRISGASVFVFFITYYFFIVRWFLERRGFFMLLGRLVVLYGLVFALATLFTDFIIVASRQEGLGSFPVFSSLGWFVFYGYVIFLTVTIIATLLRDYFKSPKEKKRKIKYFLFGVLLFTGINFTFNVIYQVLFQNYRFYQLGNYSTIFLIGFTVYAIVKHELFDIKVVTTKVFTAIIWVILFGKIFVSESTTELIVDSGILILVVVFGVLLIKSVMREVGQREKLQELTEKLKALDKQKDEFISMAAHELRAPMTAIKGYVSMIMEGDAGEISATTKDYLTDVSSVNDRLIRLVNNMLNVSRIEEGRLIYRTEIVRLGDVAKSVFTSFKFEAEHKSLGFGLNIPDNIKDTLEVDGDRLTEVVGNFVSNAVKYTEKGRIDMKITQPNPHTVRFAVVDTGPGVTEKEQEKLFQKFFRVHSTAGKTIGTGLGLYISKLLIHKFNGKLGINSEIGKGSEFWFELPVTDKKPSDIEEKVENTDEENPKKIKSPKSV